MVPYARACTYAAAGLNVFAALAAPTTLRTLCAVSFAFTTGVLLARGRTSHDR
ncbi:hypothetical protein [Actinoplanes subtropicus]|uniref:hypothetical protein n=1 Tax=Actinoplanes subtropicus TaxID=543632 RepID=UPI000B300970|nr:hypothetical protein [Actinoplanes subtropicus]